MRLLSLGFSSLRRNQRRTLLTSLSLAVSLFLFVSLFSVRESLDRMVTKIGENAVIAVIHRGGFTHDMPESHWARLRAVPGAVEVVAATYYGGVFGEVAGPQDTFPTMALTTSDVTRTIFGDDVKIDSAEWQTWMNDRTAALVGPQLMRRYGWHKGQRVTLRGSFRRVDLSFTIVGTAAFFSDQSNFMLHREYLEEALGNPGIVSMYWVKAPSVAEMPALIGRINETLGTSSDPVKAMSQKQLISSFLGLLGDVRGVVGGMGLLVMIAVFFVTLNSMALSARERVPEIAVLKAIGFPAGDVLASLLFEGLVLGLLGGGLGSAVAWALFNAFPLEVGFGPLSGFSASPGVVGMGFGLAALTGMLAMLPPALRATRLPVVDALRRRD